MSRSVLVACLQCLLSWAPVSAQVVSDAALAECQSDTAAFAPLAMCLPQTQVAGEMVALVQTDAFYGDDGRILIRDCAAVNTSTPAIWACAYRELLMAHEAGRMVGDLTRLDDPVLAGFADPGKFERWRRQMHETLEAFGHSPILEIPHNTNMLSR